MDKGIDKEVARIIERCVQLLAEKAPRLQEFEKIMLDMIEFMFGPKRVIYHVLLVCFLQAAGMGIQLTRDGLKYSFSFLSASGKKQMELMRQLGTAKNYAEWRKIALELDKLLGADKWRSKEDSSLIDSKIIKNRIADTNDMMKRGEIFEMMFRLRGGLARDQFGMQNEKLFRNALAGTKLLVEKYHQTIAASLDFICDTVSTVEEVLLPLV
jgi:TAG lipase/steryl ester hydrolase/phospholipase A2/LPA acyltransferase